jgi:hypothetical protein
LFKEQQHSQKQEFFVIDVLDYQGTPVGFIVLSTELKYFGSIVHHSSTSDADVGKLFKSPSSFPSPMRSNHVLHYKRLSDSLPYFIC